MDTVRHLWVLLGKEMMLELRARLRINALIPFACVVLLLLSLSVGPQPALLRRMAPAFFWLALLLASTLGLAAATRVEEEHGAQEGLSLLGVGGAAQYLAKALVNALLVTLLGVVLWPLAIALLGLNVDATAASLFGVLLLGAGAISAPGTLLAALATRARGHDVLLPLLLYPVVIPGLVAVVRASGLLILGDPMQELQGWVALLAAFNLVYGLLGSALYARVVEA